MSIVDASTRAARKVVILSASVGAGHDAMAKGIQAEIRATHPGIEVVIADALDVIRPGMSAEWKTGYEKMANSSWRYGLHYRLGTTRIAQELGQRSFSKQAEGPLVRYLAEQQPDVVVSTFPYVSNAIGKAHANGLVDARVVTTLIDPDPHRGWFGRGVDAHAYLFPGDKARVVRLDPLQGVEHLRLQQGRPPVDSRLFDAVDTAEVRRTFGLPTDRPVALVSGGSLGLGMDASFIDKLRATNPNVTWAIVTGKNVELAEMIGRTFDPSQVVAIPFTREMPALLRSVDAAVTNSGGMTTIEAFAAGTPVVMHNVVAGHGTDAATALQADGLVTYAKGTNDLRVALESIGRPDGQLATQAARATHEVFGPSVPKMSDVVLGPALLSAG